MEKGIIVGCDNNLEWLLPWWWENYSSYNSYPVCFVDFGMSKKAIDWCKGKGKYLFLNSFVKNKHSKKNLSKKKIDEWEYRYAGVVWSSRSSWLKKPSALINSPFDYSIWIDLDCEIKGSLNPIFNCLNLKIELAIARDLLQTCHFLLPKEIHYNSGVIAFKKGAKILKQWQNIMMKLENILPGDQEFLTRAIFLHKPELLELPHIYNWPRAWGNNDKVIIHHFYSIKGKLDILKSSKFLKINNIFLDKKN